MSKDKKSRVRFSSKIVIASVSAVLFYTIFIFFLELLNIKYGTNIQVPVDLTAAWYTFWTVELVCLASIRKAKIKNKYEYDDPDREKGMSEILEGLRRIGEGTEVVTPSTRQAPVEVYVNPNQGQSSANVPTTVVPTRNPSDNVDPTEIPTVETTMMYQDTPVKTVPPEPVTDDEPVSDYHFDTNEDLDSSLPKISGKHYNDSYADDDQTIGG